MIKVYEAANLVDAQLVCDWLRSDGIDAHVQGAYISGAAGELPADTTTSVWIKHPMYKLRARALVEQFERERQQPLPTIDCPSCGEIVEGNFALCWQCGAELMPTDSS